MISISKLLPYMVLIFDVSSTFFLRPHEHQNVFRDRRAINNRTACILPDQPKNGFYRRLDRTVNQLTLEFGCKNGYKLSSNFQYMICTRNGWIPRVPRTCIKICKPLLSTDAVTYTCENEGEQVPCDEATDGTSATFQCSPYYEPEDPTVTNIFCRKSYWNKKPQLCQPVCGKKRVEAIPLIVNGQSVSKGDYPWSTAVFHEDDNGTITNICGGSMLTQRVILTAAHCVTNFYGAPTSVEKIRIGVGKYYNKYNDPRDKLAQYSKVSVVVVHQQYDPRYYGNDIALVITQDRLLLSKAVQPVCYQDLPKFRLTPGFIGVATGWGYTKIHSTPSDELLEARISYIPYEVCLGSLPKDYLRYLTYEKLCSGGNETSTLCSGDSGAGIAFKNNKMNRYYIGGVASVNANQDCDPHNSNVIYTNVAKHYEWLQRKIFEHTGL